MSYTQKGVTKCIVLIVVQEADQSVMVCLVVQTAFVKAKNKVKMGGKSGSV